METVTQLTQEETEKRASIMLCAELETTFKLYSYRVISHESFTSRVKELTQVYKSSIKNPKNGG